MRYRSDPKRQCIGCRKVQPKKELLRLVRLPSGKIAFDAAYMAEGRGLYLCPEKSCFKKAYGNKKARSLFNNGEQLEGLVKEIRGIIMDNIDKDIALCDRMGCLEDLDEHMIDTAQGNTIIIHSETSQEKKEKIHAAAQKRKAEVYEGPGICMKKAAHYIVKDGFPSISRLKRNLRIYERLSSKGLAR